MEIEEINKLPVKRYCSNIDGTQKCPLLNEKLACKLGFIIVKDNKGFNFSHDCTLEELDLGGQLWCGVKRDIPVFRPFKIVG